jgi:hypothetical protein
LIYFSTGVAPSCLSFLVNISALDLSYLLAACPKVESLTLLSLDIAMSDAQASMELNSASLKDLSAEGISLEKLMLEADSLEKLQLKDCTLECFELTGKGTLKLLKIDDVSVIHLDIGESTENLYIGESAENLDTFT